MIILWFFLGAALLFLAQHKLYATFWDKRLKIDLRFDQKSVAAGDDVTIETVVTNRKPLSLPLLEYRYYLCRNFDAITETGGKPKTVRFQLAMPGRRMLRSRLELSGLSRGIYTISGGTLGAQDLFYFGSFTAPFSSLARLTVYPAKLPADQIQLPYQQLLGAVLTKRFAQEDPFEIRNIRPYEPFDPMRTINWKASAKTGELKVNQRDYTTEEALFLILDMEHGTEEQRERVISLASSLCTLFLRRGISVAVCANSRGCISGGMLNVPLGGGVSHANIIDERLAQIKLAAEPPMGFAAFLEHLAETSVRRPLCAVISAGGSAEVSAAFDRLCGSQTGYYIHLADGEPVPAGSHFTVLPYQERGAEA